MAEWLFGLMLMNPRAFRAVGRGLLNLGGFLLLFGWQGHRVLALIDRRLGRVGQDAPDSLAQLYPTLPTWWIPETWIGYSLAVLLIVVGFLTSHTARSLEKF